MCGYQQSQFGHDAENLDVLSPNQYMYPVHGQQQVCVPQFDPTMQQYWGVSSPNQHVYPVYGQYFAPQLSEFQADEQQTNEPSISHQIDRFNKHIAKMLHSAEMERFTDPKFAEWCHEEAEYFMNFRDSLLRDEPTRKYGSEHQTEHSLIEESPALLAVEKQRVGNSEHQHLMGQSISEVPKMVIGNLIELPCLEPTKILGTNSGSDDSPLCRDMKSGLQETTAQEAAKDNFINFDELCGWVDRLKSVPVNSKVTPKQQPNFEPDFSFTSFDLPRDEDPNETIPKWVFQENPDRNLVHEAPKLPKFGRITNTVGCKWSGNNVPAQQRELEKEVACQQEKSGKTMPVQCELELDLLLQWRESGSAVIYRLSSHPMSFRPRIIDDVRAKWSKRRLKDASMDRKSALDFGLNHGIGDKKRGFRWTKRRMKSYFGHGKFGQRFTEHVQSRTIDLLRGAGGIDGSKRNEKEGKGTAFDEGMMKWAENRMRKWRDSTARNASNRQLERVESGLKIGNSNIDRGRKHFEVGPKAQEIRQAIIADFWSPRSEGSCSWSTTKRPFGRQLNGELRS